MIDKSGFWKAKISKSVQLSSISWGWYNPADMKTTLKTRAKMHPTWCQKVIQNEVTNESDK